MYIQTREQSSYKYARSISGDSSLRQVAVPLEQAAASLGQVEVSLGQM
jgi:hypothetical protein